MNYKKITDDTIVLSNGISIWNFFENKKDAESKKNELDSKKDYEGYSVMTYRDHLDNERKRLVRPQVEIPEEEFFYAQNVLPPMGWKNNGVIEWFFMEEMYVGTYTNQYARLRLAKGKSVFYKKMVDMSDKSTFITGTSKS